MPSNPRDHGHRHVRAFTAPAAPAPRPPPRILIGLLTGDPEPPAADGPPHEVPPPAPPRA